MPKPKVFRFENYWLEHAHFIPVLQHACSLPTQQTNSAKIVTARFKSLRRVLKDWQKQLPNMASTIQTCKDLILFLDVLEEDRDLSTHEWNLRHSLIQHLQTLLHHQRIYWRQRGNIKWVKLGDECTQFFHTNASIKNRLNSITSLTNQTGVTLYDHAAKASLLWESFKERLGTTDFSHMYFDLLTLIQVDHDLEWLHSPITKKEIDKITHDLPNNKSPGPDGFNGEFIKKCWGIIC